MHNPPGYSIQFDTDSKTNTKYSCWFSQTNGAESSALALSDSVLLNQLNETWEYGV